MTDTVLRMLPAIRRRKCSICGHSARPGTNLCSACRAALKRARHETVSQLEPLPRSSRKHRSKPAAPVARTAPTTTAATPRRGWRQRDTVSVALCVLVVGVVLYTQTRGGAHSDPIPPPAEVPAAAPAVATPAPLPTAADELATILPPASTVAPAPAANAKSASAAARAARVMGPVVPPGTTLESYVPPAEPPAPVVAPPPTPPRETPRPDRWQQMNDAVARCGGQDFLAKLVCEQRARAQACDGYWGTVPQCPPAVQTEHGA